MPRQPRFDAPGALHHVMNRGVARRTVFESADDARYFLSRLARQVHAGELEIHAYAVLFTHYHLLVRSLRGRLSEILRSAQNDYARRFNRSRRRDGPLFRGRFRSRRVDTFEYQVELIRYIDANPVEARLCSRAQDFPLCSAFQYARAQGPPWLERSWVEERVRVHSGIERYDPRRYSERFAPVSGRLSDGLVARRLERAGLRSDPLDALIQGGPSEVRSWLERKAQLADGTSAGLPVCDPGSIEREWNLERSKAGRWTIYGRKRSLDPWLILRVGLLRDMCGATLEEVGQRTGTSISTAARKHAAHRRLVSTDSEYAERAGALMSRLLCANRSSDVVRVRADGGSGVAEQEVEQARSG